MAACFSLSLGLLRRRSSSLSSPDKVLVQPGLSASLGIKAALPSPVIQSPSPGSCVSEEEVVDSIFSTCLGPILVALNTAFFSVQPVPCPREKTNTLRPEIDEHWNLFPGQKLPPQWELGGGSGSSNHVVKQSHGPSQPSVTDFTQRPDSGVGLRSEDDASSQATLASTTTVPESIYDYHTVGTMQFLKTEFSIFRVDQDMQQHMRTIHAFYKHIDSGELLPTEARDAKSVLDVGTGAGDWALDVSDANPDTRVFGYDVAAIQPTSMPDNTWFYIDDANSPYWAWDDRFNFIHMRGINGAIKAWKVTLHAAFRCMQPGGVIEISDTSYQPPGTIRPGSVWPYWFWMLSALTEAAGLDVDIHHGDRAQRELKDGGYTFLRQPQDYYLITTIEDERLLVSVVEEMKGILTRALQFVPSLLSRDELMGRLEREVLRDGVLIRVERIFAQKPHSVVIMAGQKYPEEQE